MIDSDRAKLVLFLLRGRLPPLPQRHHMGARCSSCVPQPSRPSGLRMLSDFPDGGRLSPQDQLAWDVRVDWQTSQVPNRSPFCRNPPAQGTRVQSPAPTRPDSPDLCDSSPAGHRDPVSGIQRVELVGRPVLHGSACMAPRLHAPVIFWFFDRAGLFRAPLLGVRVCAQKSPGNSVSPTILVT